MKEKMKEILELYIRNVKLFEDFFKGNNNNTEELIETRTKLMESVVFLLSKSDEIDDLFFDLYDEYEENTEYYDYINSFYELLINSEDDFVNQSNELNEKDLFFTYLLSATKWYIEKYDPDDETKDNLYRNLALTAINSRNIINCLINNETDKIFNISDGKIFEFASGGKASIYAKLDMIDGEDYKNCYAICDILMLMTYLKYLLYLCLHFFHYDAMLEDRGIVLVTEETKGLSENFTQAEKVLKMNYYSDKGKK